MSGRRKEKPQTPDKEAVITSPIPELLLTAVAIAAVLKAVEAGIRKR